MCSVLELILTGERWNTSRCGGIVPGSNLILCSAALSGGRPSGNLPSDCISVLVYILIGRNYYIEIVQLSDVKEDKIYIILPCFAEY